MAKLPRLMQAGLPQSIDPAHFADTGESISGDLSIKGMERIEELLSDKEARVSFRLEFERDARQRINIRGDFCSTLGMLCQRCLQPVQVDVEHKIATVLITDEAEAATLPKNREGFLLRGKRLALSALIEEELLLALPLAPTHESASCHFVATDKAGHENDTQQPFRVLADMKSKLAKD